LLIVLLLTNDVHQAVGRDVSICFVLKSISVAKKTKKVTHKVIIVAFPIIEQLTVLMVAQ